MLSTGKKWQHEFFSVQDAEKKADYQCTKAITQVEPVKK